MLGEALGLGVGVVFETRIGAYIGFGFAVLGLGVLGSGHPTSTTGQMEKNTEHEMETGIIQRFIGIGVGVYVTRLRYGGH